MVTSRLKRLKQTLNCMWMAVNFSRFCVGYLHIFSLEIVVCLIFPRSSPRGSRHFVFLRGAGTQCLTKKIDDGTYELERHNSFEVSGRALMTLLTYSVRLHTLTRPYYNFFSYVLFLLLLI